MELLKKSVLSVLLIFIFGVSSTFAQTNPISALENEKKIERFIEENIRIPFPKEALHKIITTYNADVHAHEREGSHGHEHRLLFENLSIEEQEVLIQTRRRDNLRIQYFKDNPETKELYQSEPMPVCENGGFETGDFTYFTGEIGSGDSTEYYGGECDAIPTSGDGYINWVYSYMTPPFRDYFKLVSAGPDPVIDVYGGAFLSRVHSGDYAARVNSPKIFTTDYCGFKPDHGINKLIKTVTLEKDGAQQISFYYALVSQFPDHPNGNPVFVARAIDANDSEFDRICIVSNPQNNPFFNKFTPVNPECDYAVDEILWKDWSCGTLEVFGNIGDEIQLEFIQSDCAHTLHFAYAYIDDICESCIEGEGDTIGSINLDPINPCQRLPFDVCGTFTLPELNGVQGTINNLTLDILQNGAVAGTLTSYTTSGNTFCFTIDANDFPSQSGGYDFRANVIYDIAGGNTSADDTHTNPGQNNDYIFDNPDCCEIEALVTDIKCDDQGTIDPSDDTWSFDLTVTNSPYYGTTWEASNPVNVMGNYGATTTISMGNISAYGATIDFKVFDPNDIDCFTNVVIDVPAPCSRECTLEAITSIGSCNDNGTPLDPSDDYYSITLDVFNTNGEPWMVLSSNMSIIYFGAGDENNVDLGNYPVSNQSEWFWVKLSNYPECFVDVVVTAPTTCDFTCNIEALVTVGECDDNGTPHDTSDDFYFITVHVVGTSGLPWQLIGYPNGQAVTASGTGNTTSITLGPISTNDSSWPLYIFSTDPQHSDCRSETLVHAPTCDRKKESRKVISISPNPNTGAMGIRAQLENTEAFELNIYRFDGALVATFKDLKTSDGAFSMDYQSNLPTGLYYFIFIVNGETINKTVIIK